jgi:CHAD domain-containing protein
MSVSDLRETLEREVKLSPGHGFAMPELGGHALESRVFVSTYHDTEDHLLARSGLTLRHRVENGRGLWQLKLPSGDARLELEVGGPPRTVPPKIVTLLHAFLRHGRLVPVARLRTRRVGVRVDGAEVVHDSVAVLEGQRVARTFDELEVELVEGDERSLKRIEKALRRAGAADGEFRPKLFRALDLSFDPDPDEPPQDGSAVAALATAFRVQYTRMLAYDPGTRLGTEPESLHQLRVATRRFRTFLRMGRPLFEEGWADELRSDLGWLGAALGPVRDLDVLLARLRSEAAMLGAPDEDAAAVVLRALARERSTARRRLSRALGHERYVALLDRLDAAGSPPVAADGPGGTPQQLWRREHARLRKVVAGLGADPEDAELHAVRIRVKRARYAGELAGMDAYVRVAKRLQDVLGDHQDAVVAEGRLRALAATHPDSAVAAGRLIERERERRERTRAGWRKRWAELAKQAKKV